MLLRSVFCFFHSQVIKLARGCGSYLLCQVLLIEVLGFLPPEEDTWSLLYIPLWAEIKMVYPARKAYLSMGALGILMIATLMLTFDWYIGIGYGVFMAAVGFFQLTPDLVYAQSEAAHAMSLRLLSESKKANNQLKKAARQAAELSAIQERIRLANDLHDSVSQLMFSIKLLAAIHTIINGQGSGGSTAATRSAAGAFEPRSTSNEGFDHPMA